MVSRPRSGNPDVSAGHHIVHLQRSKSSQSPQKAVHHSAFLDQGICVLTACVLLFAMLHGSSAFEDDSCYRKIADGSAQLEHCAPNPSRLMESIADVISAQKSGSLAETWLRLGIRMHDIVSQAPEGSRGGWTERLSASGKLAYLRAPTRSPHSSDDSTPSECKTTVSNPQWAGSNPLSS